MANKQELDKDLDDQEEDEIVEIPNVDDFEEDAESDEGSGSNEPSIEDRAREMGWRPSAEFDGDEADWVDAKEFVARAPLYEGIHKTKREVKQLRETMATLQEHHKRTLEATRKKALEQARAELKEAANNNDIEAALALKDKINDLEEQGEEVEEGSESGNKPLSQKEVKEIHDTWVGKNKWFNEDKKIKYRAIAIGYEVKDENPDMPYAEVLEEITKRVKEEFPAKFGNPQKRKPSKVAKPGANAGKGNSKDRVLLSQLPEEVRTVYRRLVKSDRNPFGPLTHEEFMADYTAQGGEVNE